MTEYIVKCNEFVGVSGKTMQFPEYIDMNQEIVRCRDCRAMRVKYGNTGIECWMNGEPFTVEPNGFCAWAKRKEGGDD